jgi:O-antigen biosynthesis alpha-1,2-mannosyltransferase
VNDRTELWLGADGRWSGSGGIGRFSDEVLKRLPEAKILTGGPPPTHPLGSVWSGWWVRRHRPEVFFSPGYTPPFASSAVTLCVVHDLIHLKFPAESSPLKRFFYENVLRPTIRRTGCVVTVSEFSRRDIADWLGIALDCVVVAYNAVGPQFSPSGNRVMMGFPYALYVGNQRQHKNVVRLIESMAALERARDLHLVLTGRPSVEVGHAIEHLKLTKRVRFIGNVDDESLPALYRGAELLVLPSMYEGFGLPVLEAMACGTPVAASNCTSIPEIAGDAAFLFEPDSTCGIAAAIDRIATDSSLRSELRAKGLERARSFSWDNTVRIIRQTLTNLRREHSEG